MWPWTSSLSLFTYNIARLVWFLTTLSAINLIWKTAYLDSLLWASWNSCLEYQILEWWLQPGKQESFPTGTEWNGLFSKQKWYGMIMLNRNLLSYVRLATYCHFFSRKKKNRTKLVEFNIPQILQNVVYLHN